VPGARLLAIADIDVAAAESCARELGVSATTPDYGLLLDDPAIDAVALCSSTHTHARIIADAAAAGKHVFCEKPIDLDLARIDSALEAVDAAGVLLQVGFNRRFDPSFARIRELVVSGEIGEPHLVRVTSRDPAPPPIDYVHVSGGIFLDMMIHDFDMARFVTGREVVGVFAAGGVLVDPQIGAAGDVDTAVVTLCFDSGALGTIDNSRRAVYGYDQRVEVFGSKGCASADNGYPNQVTVSTSRSVSRDLPLNFFIERYASAYLAEMQAFVRSVAVGAKSPVDGAEARAPVVIALAAQRSLELGQPVRMDGED
jgi:myo-inositol 2-dehydrogenase/D-chiro-inositol 1-dehydrogenase